MTDSNGKLYEFGPYQLDSQERVLTLHGRPLSLTRKAFETLLVLVRNCGHVVDKNHLLERVWPDAYVEESNLTQNIFTLRRVLGQSEEGLDYIETVPRRGYRFVAPVRLVTTPEPEALQRDDERNIGVLAVLPFINESAEPQVEQLSQGLSESLINSLSQLPRLRVMSRVSVSRYKNQEVDAQLVGRELHVDAVLVGRINAVNDRLLIKTELIEVANGWQLWGDNYERACNDLLEIQDEITKLISSTLRVRLVNDDERRLTKRYTENTAAYQAYLTARYWWEKYTKLGLQHAVGHFQKAISLDPTYAQAYAGAVDCYLRLATNYVRPAEDQLSIEVEQSASDAALSADERNSSSDTLRIRDEWDRRTAERESKRAAELKSHYPAAHQWYAVYLYSKRLYLDSLTVSGVFDTPAMADNSVADLEANIRTRLQYSEPTLAEQVQIFCMIAREQVDTGNYEAACALLQQWWTIGEWPKLERLGQLSSADLLFTAGMVAGWVVSTRQVPRGQKHAEALLNGALGIFEQGGSKTQAAEGRVELAYCHYREGLFDLARDTLITAVQNLLSEDQELKSLALIRLGTVERHAGRLQDAQNWLIEAGKFAKLTGPWVTGRYNLESATTFKELGFAESNSEHIEQALHHYLAAFSEFEAIGNHRYTAIVENNHGYLLLTLNRLELSEVHLRRSRQLFHAYEDIVRCAQVDETLAQLYIACGRFELAEQVISRAVESLELGGEEALLAEALTTYGMVLSKLGRPIEARRALDSAYRVAERCGDTEGAGRAILIAVEEVYEQIDEGEKPKLRTQLSRLLSNSQQATIRKRLLDCLKRL